MLKFFLLASFLGLAAGISPGPLLTLVITQTLRYGRREGIKIAMSPAITDLPIILFSLLVIHELAKFTFLIGIISLAGAAFLVYLGYDSFTAEQPEIKVEQDKYGSLRKGMLTNLLNPHPWMFWITIGAPHLCKSYETGSMAVAGFLGGFYFFLLGSKITIVFLVDRSRVFLKKQLYKWIMRLLGIALWIFALVLVAEGIQYFRV
ncbi:MAG: LysE family translocator [Bacteroidales bacterium]